MNRRPTSDSADRPASAAPASFTATMSRSKSTIIIGFPERRNAVQKTGS